MKRKGLDLWFAPLVGVPIGLLLCYFYWLWSVGLPVIMYDRTVDTRRVTGGSVVTVTWNGLRREECASIIYRTLILPDGRLSLFAPMRNPRQKAGLATAQFQFNVPELSVPGTVVYRVRVQYICNWVQEYLGGPILPLPDIRLDYVARENF